MTGPRILVAVFAALWLGFVAWYGGNGTPMTAEEKDALFAEIERNAAGQHEGDGTLLEKLHRLADQDDGKEFFMVNLIRYNAVAKYPAGSPYGGTGLDADARYSAAILPKLLKHGNVPVFVSEVEGRFLDEAGDPEWQRVAIVRYRSRRDLLKMVVELAGKPIGIHKWASIERTQVFPTRLTINLVFVRGFVAAVLAVLGAGLHLVLRKISPRYAGKGK